MPAITTIGHVGIYCDDVERQLDFYTRVLGFKVTDQRPEGGFYFLSTDPEREHHMVLLRPGGRGDGKVLQQLSFHTASLGEVREFHRRLVAAGRRSVRRSPTATRSASTSGIPRQPAGDLLGYGRVDPAAVQRGHRPGSRR